MAYVGDIRLGQTFTTGFVTASASTGAPTTLSGSPVISAYVGSSTTELTAGITLTVDFDSRTGYNTVSVVATTGNGYAAGTDIRLVITTGTVGGVSAVGYVVAEFSIENRVMNIGSTPILTGAYPQLYISDSGTAQGSPTTTGIQLRAASPSFGLNALRGQTLYVFGSTQGYWQAAYIQTNTAGAGSTLVTDGVAIAPSGTVTYQIGGTAPISSTGVTVNAASVLTALGMASGNMDTQLSGIDGRVSNLQTRTVASLIDGRVPADISAALVATLTEAYPTLGSAPSVASALNLLVQFLTAASVSGSEMTIARLNGSPAFTLTLNAAYPAVLPSSITRDT